MPHAIRPPHPLSNFPPTHLLITCPCDPLVRSCLANRSINLPPPCCDVVNDLITCINIYFFILLFIIICLSAPFANSTRYVSTPKTS